MQLVLALLKLKHHRFLNAIFTGWPAHHTRSERVIQLSFVFFINIQQSPPDKYKSLYQDEFRITNTERQSPASQEAAIRCQLKPPNHPALTIPTMLLSLDPDEKSSG